ncbi:DUF4402 domain-containing protein [Sphingomonas sabuli]|uniref:DUF4402 domain-containing protein n=1 Tax=Sphingomonas sabuli TaxID=2764186 RepID=A0A7G9L0G3_9SPHN|nr:DUF4402 domain-containing protein [Sphingomonas sabuli]QNM82112.1 DUF4402 domain-containing protein [Sphingomonas sabuli]
MASRYALIALAAAAALLAGVPSSASAQCRLCSTPTTELATDANGADIQLSLEAALDFDNLVLDGDGQGEATLLPTGHRSASGSVTAVSARAMVGSVAITGVPGRAVRIDLPPRIELHSSRGGRIIIESIETDLPSAPRLDSAGNLNFRFGGRLDVRGGIEGDYRGDVPITVEYL